jgi:hypothetical protein
LYSRNLIRQIIEVAHLMELEKSPFSKGGFRGIIRALPNHPRPPNKKGKWFFKE